MRRSPLPSPAVNVCCSSKSQRSTIPASSTTRFNWSSPQRPRTPGRLRASTRRAVSTRRFCPVASRDRICCNTRHWSAHGVARNPDPLVHSFERAFEGDEQVFDGPLARLDIARGSRPCLAETRLGEIEKRAIVRLQGIRRQRLKRVTQDGFGLLICVKTR